VKAFAEEKTGMMLSSGKEELSVGRQDPVWLSADGHERMRMTGVEGRSGPQNSGEDRRGSEVKGSSSDKSSSLRKEKVREAIRKKQDGRYDSEEVYRRIAEKLIDHFGI
jgi:hypothetical protein